MIYTFGRVGAVVKMRVEDYYTQGRRGWMRLREKGGKRHEMPCNHNLEAYIDAYVAAAAIAGGPLPPKLRCGSAIIRLDHRDHPIQKKWRPP